MNHFAAFAKVCHQVLGDENVHFDKTHNGFEGMISRLSTRNSFKFPPFNFFQYRTRIYGVRFTMYPPQKPT